MKVRPTALCAITLVAVLVTVVVVMWRRHPRHPVGAPEAEREKGRARQVS